MKLHYLLFLFFLFFLSCKKDDTGAKHEKVDVYIKASASTLGLTLQSHGEVPKMQLSGTNISTVEFENDYTLHAVYSSGEAQTVTLKRPPGIAGNMVLLVSKTIDPHAADVLAYGTGFDSVTVTFTPKN